MVGTAHSLSLAWDESDRESSMGLKVHAAAFQEGGCLA